MNQNPSENPTHWPLAAEDLGHLSLDCHGVHLRAWIPLQYGLIVPIETGTFCNFTKRSTLAKSLLQVALASDITRSFWNSRMLGERLKQPIEDGRFPRRLIPTFIRVFRQMVELKLFAVSPTFRSLQDMSLLSPNQSPF